MLFSTREKAIFVLAIAVLLVLDQATKAWIVSNMRIGERIGVLPFFDLYHVRNTGIAFGLGQSAWGGLLLVPVTGLIIGWLLNMFVSDPEIGGLERWGLFLIAIGASGNLIDRIWHGSVVDFVYLHWNQWGFYVFNVADATITVGVCIALLGTVLAVRAGQKGET